jgi:hypothetical protein
MALADWLRQCGVTTIAMESTGIYWIPLFELLETRGFEVYLVEPRQSRHAPGRPKSDVLDCQWLQRLHSYGLLTASFRPAEQVVVLRSYLRQRQMLIRYAGQHVQHMQKALEQMNVKLTEVVSDVTGVTGMAIIQAILHGERDPLQLAKLRNDKCKRTEAEIARALYGNWRAEHLFALRQAVEVHTFYRQQLRACDDRLQVCLSTFADQSKGQPQPCRQRRHTKRVNEPTFDVSSALYRMSGVDLTVLEGVDPAGHAGSDLMHFTHLYAPPFLRHVDRPGADERAHQRIDDRECLHALLLEFQDRKGMYAVIGRREGVVGRQCRARGGI